MASLELLSTHSSEYLATSLAKHLRASHRHTIRDTFEDGEHYYRINLNAKETLAGKNVVVVGSTESDTSLLELYRIGSTLADLGTRRRIFVIPFLGYSTMDRAKLSGEVVTAKVNARLLSSIPQTGLGNTFLLLDLHEPALLHYFEHESTPLELSAEDMLVDRIKKLRLKSYVLGSADLGMPRQITRLAAKLKVDVALVSKSREFAQTSVLAAVGDVKGRSVVIYDDMVRSGSSLIKAADAYRKQGATAIYAAITHLALTTPKVVQNLEQSMIKKIIATDSHPHSTWKELNTSKTIDIVPVAPLFAKAIKNLLW